MSAPWNPRSIIWLREATEAVPCPCCDETAADCPLCEGIGEVSPEMALDFLADGTEGDNG
ncbi:hypothetical protein [Deinococcus sp. UYEF24]